MRLPILAAASILIALPLAAQEREKSHKEKPPGEMWTFEAKKGETTRRGEFRTHDNKVFMGGRNVGTVTTKGDETTLVVRGQNPLNGRVLLKRDGGVWRGVIEGGNGSKSSIVVTPKEAKMKEKPERKKEKKPV